ncbi:hypothetical protein [Dolichospermum flos-aquae]|nr:hypothetical protein [Dolichospermum flos-aquae]
MSLKNLQLMRNPGLRAIALFSQKCVNERSLLVFIKFLKVNV